MRFPKYSRYPGSKKPSPAGMRRAAGREPCHCTDICPGSQVGSGAGSQRRWLQPGRSSAPAALPPRPGTGTTARSPSPATATARFGESPTRELHVRTGTPKPLLPQIKYLRLPHLNFKNLPSGWSRLVKDFERREAERVNSVSTPSGGTSTIPTLLQQHHTVHPLGARAPAAATPPESRRPPRTPGFWR